MKITLNQLTTIASNMSDEVKVRFLAPFLHRPPKKQALAYAKELSKGLTEDEIYELLTFLQKQVNDEETWKFFTRWRSTSPSTRKKKK